MSWLSGVFSRVLGVSAWVTDKNNAVKILASRHDTNDQDLADGINACITRDNQAKPTADFLPSADNTLALGSASFRWAAISGVAFSDFALQSQPNTFSGSTNGVRNLIGQNTSAASNAAMQLAVINNASRGIGLLVTSSAYSGAFLTGGPSGESANIYMGTSLPISIGTNGIERVRIAGDGSVINLQATSVQVNSKPIAYGSAFKAAATARSSTTTFTDDPDLVIASLPAGTYEIEAVLFFTGTTTGTQGYKARFSFTGTVADALCDAMYQQAGTLFAQSNSFGGGVLTIISSGSVFTAGAGIDGVVCRGTATLSNTNTLSVQWAQNSSSANATNLLQMSRLTARRIA